MCSNGFVTEPRRTSDAVHPATALRPCDVQLHENPTPLSSEALLPFLPTPIAARYHASHFVLDCPRPVALTTMESGMDWLSPTQLLFVTIGVPLLVAGLGAWLLDPSPRTPARTDAFGQDLSDRGAPSRSAPAPPRPSSPSLDRVPRSGA